MERWLGEYSAPRVIRRRGAFHSYAARRVTDRSSRLVVTSAPTADPRAAHACLARLAEGHRAMKGEHFLHVAETGQHEGVAYVAFEGSPLCDGEAAIARLGETNTRVEYAEAIAVVDRLGRALEAAHRGQAPHTGGALVLDGVGWANLIVDTGGSLHVLGLGHNVAGRDENGVLSGAPSFFVAPERAAGAAQAASGDVYAFVALQRSVLSYCALPPPLQRVFLGTPEAGDEEVAEIVRWSTEHVLAAAPSDRPSMSELRTRWEREWALFGLAPDGAALGARLVALFAGATGEVVLGRDGDWIRSPDGVQHRLDGRGPLKRVVLRLIDEHQRSRGQRLAAEMLLAAGWPGERPSHEAGLNRVYAAMSKLRAMGLREVLQRDDTGYRIDPQIAVRREE